MNIKLQGDILKCIELNVTLKFQVLIFGINAVIQEQLYQLYLHRTYKMTTPIYFLS